MQPAASSNPFEAHLPSENWGLVGFVPPLVAVDDVTMSCEDHSTLRQERHSRLEVPRYSMLTLTLT